MERKISMRVLVVEDEIRLAENISRILREKENFAVDIANNGVDGLHMAKTNPYDLIILDLMLPGMDGLELLRRIRKTGSSTAVLILTALDSTENIIAGLNTGSDDYLTKPFDIGELLARCKALIRRSYGKTTPKIQFGKVSIDTVARRVFLDEQEINLTAMEYHTLEYLAMRKGEIVSKTELLEHLYDFNWERFSNVVEVYISTLRAKLDPEKSSSLIQTLRGQGYIIKI
ncbi:MAG TPA: response regulator transcription factor [Sedimentisphaerales bacterium]|nr:response regulator transcription factor [Sedimentisphaerales bacterium]